MKIILKDLPKVSLNKWYEGFHWSKRKQIKDIYKLLLSKIKPLSKEKSYKCEYIFKFKNKPLDASNCVAMLKMIEDILFENDSYKIITEITIKSMKGNSDIVEINIEEL